MFSLVNPTLRQSSGTVEGVVKSDISTGLMNESMVLGDEMGSVGKEVIFIEDKLLTHPVVSLFPEIITMLS